MTLRNVIFGVLALCYVAVGTLYVGFHHLPHFLDLFYGSVVLAPVAIACGILVGDWRLAIPLYFILFAEFFALAAAMSPPASIMYFYLIGYVVSSLINGVVSSLLYLLGRALRSKLVVG